MAVIARGLVYNSIGTRSIGASHDRRIRREERQFAGGGKGPLLSADARRLFDERRAGRVIYIGKAKNLRARAGSYFLQAAAEDPRTAKLVREIRDIDYLDAESEIDALLMEARLIKDILPKFNRDLRDDKTFPYLEIFTHEDFPRVRFTREPQPRGTKLYGPFANPRGLRGAIQVLQKIFKFRTCSLDIDPDDPRWRWFRPCLLHSINQCTAPCNLRISKEEYRKDIHRLQRFLEGGKKKLLAELRGEMAAAAADLQLRAGRPAPRRNRHARNARRPRDAGNARPAGGLSRRSETRPGRAAESAALGPAAADHRGHRHRPHGRHRHGRGGGEVPRRAAVQAGLPADADSRRDRPRRRGQHPRGRRRGTSSTLPPKAKRRPTSC